MNTYSNALRIKNQDQINMGINIFLMMTFWPQIEAEEWGKIQSKLPELQKFLGKNSVREF